MFVIPGTNKWNNLKIEEQNNLLGYYCNIKTGIILLLVIYIVYLLYQLTHK